MTYIAEGLLYVHTEARRLLLRTENDFSFPPWRDQLADRFDALTAA